MTTPRFIRAMAPAVLFVTVGISAASPSFAGTVKGTVRLPDGTRGGRMHQGYWRLENGNVPVKPAGGKSTTVVVLDGISGTHAPPAKTVTVEIAALDAQPRVVVVGPGSVVEFKNTGKITHELSTPADVGMMPIQRLNPGTFRLQKFGAPGGYLVRCSEYPSLAISVIVVDSPFFAFADEKGGFQIPAGVPDGNATLKVWSMGRWAHKEQIDTTGKQDLTIKVAGPTNAKEPKEAEPKEADAPEGKEPEAAAPAPSP